MNNQGFLTISMVMILSILSAIVVILFNQITFSAKKLAIYEKKHYQSINLALSAIEWGMSKNWLNPSEHWFCQYFKEFEEVDQNQSTVCIKYLASSRGYYTIIKGENNHIKRYRLVLYKNNKLYSEKAHWIDYCPEKIQSNCND